MSLTMTLRAHPFVRGRGLKVGAFPNTSRDPGSPSSAPSIADDDDDNGPPSDHPLSPSVRPSPDPVADPTPSKSPDVAAAVSPSFLGPTPSLPPLEPLVIIQELGGSQVGGSTSCSKNNAPLEHNPEDNANTVDHEPLGGEIMV